jgi:hypothetical protein
VVDETIGRFTEVTVQGKYAFGQAAQRKPEMAERVYSALREAGIAVET